MTASVRVTGAKKAQRTLRKLAEDFPKESAQTLNRTSARAKTRTLRRLVTKTGVPRRELKDRIKNFKTNARRLKAGVWIGTKGGVALIKVPNKRRSSVKLTATHALEGGRFEATMRNGSRGIYQRARVARHKTRNDGQRTELPITQLRVDISADGKPILIDESTEQMQDFYPKEFKRRVKRVIDRRAKRRR